MEEALLDILSGFKDKRATKKKETETPTTQVKPDNTDPDTDIVEVCKQPNASTYFQVAQASYMKPKQRPELINQWWVKLRGLQTDTVAVYQYQGQGANSLIIGYRGTQVKSVRDLTADKRIMFNRLNESDRFQKDLETTKKILDEYGNQISCIYSVGHSLGNAIQLQIQRQLGSPFKGGKGLNGALQPKDLINTPRNYHFWYIRNDPLWSLSGRLLKKNLYVFPQASKKSLDNHSLENFKGLTVKDAVKRPRTGGRKKPTKKDLVKLGMVQQKDKVLGSGHTAPVEQFYSFLEKNTC